MRSEAYDGGGKEFKVGFAVVETTDDAVIMDRKAELLPELLAVKSEKGLDFLFLAVVNIVVMQSNLLMCDIAEKALAKVAFGGETSDMGTVMDLGPRVSRKKEFIPPLTGTMKSFVMPAKAESAGHLASIANQVGYVIECKYCENSFARFF